MRIELLLASTMWFPMDGRDHPPRLTHVRTVSGGTARNITKCFGGHSERETPGHIPNPEAKTLSADGTAGVTLWESRTPPDFLRERATHRWVALSSLNAPIRLTAPLGGRSRAPREWGMRL